MNQEPELTPATVPESLPESAAPPSGAAAPRWHWRRILVIAAAAMSALGALLALAVWLGGYGYTSAAAAALPVLPGRDPTGKALAGLERALAQVRPKGVYLIVDIVENRLWMWRNGTQLLEAVCSAGTGAILRDPRTGKEWIFDTPRGVRRIREKKKDPVWTKPDWAFVEEGEPLPKRWSERIDRVTLGDYALYLGDGYMIHGTLYQRYLGRPVTHGCIRLGDDDLEAVFRTAPVGAYVLLF